MFLWTVKHLLVYRFKGAGGGVVGDVVVSGRKGLFFLVYHIFVIYYVFDSR